MSGQVKLNAFGRGFPALATWLALLGVLVVALTPSVSPGQPREAKGEVKAGGGGSGGTGVLPSVDHKPPLPVAPPPGEQYQIPDPTRAIFENIRDFKPVASELQNKYEYDGWTETVLTAARFEAADLERYAAHDLTTQDLTRRKLRATLVWFEGVLSQVSKVEPSEAIRAQNIGGLYQARLLPVDSAPADAVRIVFVDLPQGVSVGGPDQWVSFAGYFFKKLPDETPGEARPGDERLGTSLLVGRSVTPLAGPPTTIALDKSLQIFSGIRDDEAGPIPPNWREEAAFERILLHARRFSPDELESAARTDLGFPDLFREVRASYRLSLIRLEGRLLRVRKVEESSRLKAAGIKDLYECWMIPRADANGNPVCLMITELPVGIEPQSSGDTLLNHWVSFAGYSFKLKKYLSAEKQKEDPKKNVSKLAPELIGRTVILRRDPEADSPFSWGTPFVFGLVFALIVLGVIALGLNWWFRRGDRRARLEIESIRNRNPFEEPGAPG